MSISTLCADAPSRQSRVHPFLAIQCFNSSGARVARRCIYMQEVVAIQHGLNVTCCAPQTTPNVVQYWYVLPGPALNYPRVMMTIILIELMPVMGCLHNAM